MSWYKKSSQQDIYQQYAELSTKPGDIAITGSGMSETFNISGKNINAREILNQIVNVTRPTLIANGVREIDTNPISQANAQGLAVSNEVGVIHVDIKKIFELHKQSLPPVTQLDGVQVDPDILTDLAKAILNSIGQEITEVVGHESQHTLDYGQAIQQNKPFSSVQEYPAEQYGKSMRSKVFNL